MKKNLLRVTTLILATLMIFSIVSCSSDKSGLTKEYFEQNKTEVLVNSVDYTEVFGEFENPLAIFSKEIASLDVILDEEETGANISLSIDADEKNFKNNVALQMFSEETGNIDLSVYFDKNKFALSSANLLGEGSYGIKFDKLENIIAKFDKSVIAQLFGLSEGDAAAFCEAYGINDEYIKGIADAFGKVNAQNEKYSDLSAVINELYALYESHYGEVTEETVELDGKKVDALALEMNFDKQVLQIAFDWYMGLYKESLDNTKNLMTALVPAPMREEVLPGLLETYDYSYQMMNEEFSYMLESMDLSGNMKVYIDKATGKYLMEKGELDITVDGERMNFVVEERLAQGGIAFDVVVTDSLGEQAKFTGFMGLQKTENGEKWIISMESDSEEVPVMINMGLEINKADGRYLLEMAANDGNENTAMSIGGDLIATEDGFEMSVEGITVDEEMYPFDLIIKASTKADVVEPEAFADILEMTQDEIIGVLSHFVAATSLLG